MRRISVHFFLLVLLSLLFVPQVAMATAAADSHATKKPVVKTLAAQSEAGSSSGKRSEMVNARYYVHTDAASGVAKLRLVIDLTGPVKVDAAISAFPSPKLVITAKEVSVGRLPSPMTLDGTIADKAVFSNQGFDGRVEIALPYWLNDDDYQVFTLPPDVKANKPNRIVVDINQASPPVSYNFTSGLKGKVIAIDPGHGGSDPGAIGPTGLQEKTVTMAVALKVRALLEKAGAKVLLTRQEDCDVYGPNASAADELGARANVGNANKTDVFLSIHCNAFPNRSVGGIASYYYKKSPYDLLLAQSLQGELAPGSGLTDRGSNLANFYVLKHTVMPASLVELGFISNPDEERQLITSQFQQQLAQSIVKGLDDFFAQASKTGGGS